MAKQRDFKWINIFKYSKGLRVMKQALLGFYQTHAFFP